MQRKLVPRQNFAGGFAQSDRPHGENKQRGIENEAHDENNPAGNEAHPRPLNEDVKVISRVGIHIDLEVPTQRQEHEDPNIVTTQTPPDCFPGADRKVGCQDRKSTRLNSSHANISYAVFCLKKKKCNGTPGPTRRTKDIPTCRAWRGRRRCRDGTTRDCVPSCGSPGAAGRPDPRRAKSARRGDKTVSTTAIRRTPGVARFSHLQKGVRARAWRKTRRLLRGESRRCNQNFGRAILFLERLRLRGAAQTCERLLAPGRSGAGVALLLRRGRLASGRARKLSSRSCRD